MYQIFLKSIWKKRCLIPKYYLINNQLLLFAYPVSLEWLHTHGLSLSCFARYALVVWHCTVFSLDDTQTVQSRDCPGFPCTVHTVPWYSRLKLCVAMPPLAVSTNARSLPASKAFEELQGDTTLRFPLFNWASCCLLIKIELSTLTKFQTISAKQAKS